MELRPPGYFALAALIDGPLHGYAIMQRARELSDGHVRLSTGTLYSVLDRALREGLVTTASLTLLPAVNGATTPSRQPADWSCSRSPSGSLVPRAS
jgi:Transcriptional regulator PadR-like family